jgi:hypothetical protein
MMTVRFPNGQVVTYNNAMYIVWGENHSILYKKKDGDLIARVPANCIIEWEPPCRVYDALKTKPDEKILKELKSINRRLKKLEG